MVEEAKAAGELTQSLGLATHDFRDRLNKVHTITPLDLRDIVHLEKKFGGLELLTKANKLQDVLYILWLSLRKEGLTEQEIVDGKWKVTEDHVARYFSPGDMSQLKELLSKLFIISGFKEEQVKKAFGSAEKAADQTPPSLPASALEEKGPAASP